MVERNTHCTADLKRLFSHPHVVPNLYDLSSSAKHKYRYSERLFCWLTKKTDISQNILFYVAQKKVSHTGRVAKGWNIYRNVLATFLKFLKYSKQSWKVSEMFRLFATLHTGVERYIIPRWTIPWIYWFKWLTILKQKYIERNTQNNLKL